MSEPQHTTPPADIEPHAEMHKHRQVVAFVCIILPFIILAAATWLGWNWIKAFVERFYQ